MFRLSLAALAATAFTVAPLCAQHPVVEHEITIPGYDYAFQAPNKLPAGWTAIRFENRGEVDHELVLVRMKEGKTLADAMEVMQREGDPRTLMDGFGGVLIASPGETGWGRILVHLEPGRTYVLICNFHDEEGAPSHAQLGMVASFTVE